MNVKLDYYTRCADEYHRQTFFLDPTGFLLPLLEKLTPGALILDVGCGSGRDLLWFKNRGFRVYGFERSYPLACLARRLVGCHVIVGDFERFDFSRCFVDALLLIGALVHVPHRRFAGVLGNILAAVKPDGFVLLSMKEGDGAFQDPCGRIFYYWSEEALEAVLDSLGLHRLEMLRQVSIKDPRDIWLSYVLQKPHRSGRIFIGARGLSETRSGQNS